MRSPLDISIRTKLMVLLVGAVSLALVIEFGVSTASDIRRIKAAMAEHHSVLADVVGANSHAALSFKDPSAAKTVLSSLHLEPAVTFACTYDAGGKVFTDDEGEVRAIYQAKDSPDFAAPPVGRDGTSFSADGHLEVFKQITKENQILGTVYLRVSMERLNWQVRNNITIAAMVLIAALTAALLLGWRLQRMITEPIYQLVQATAIVSQKGDYSLRVPKQASDEIGLLCDGFNTMLAQIQKGEAELEQHQLHLEELVLERTRALEAKTQELGRSNAELELFASVASHDLQEPLRMVASYMELLNQRYREHLDDKAKRWIGFAVDGVVRMKQLINDLLEFSRVGTRGKPFAFTDCNAVFQSVLQMLQQAINDREALVTSGPLPTVFADASQLAQVLQNLLGNAIKFHGQRPPEVHVEAVRQDDAWRFSVRDNGIGIDPQFAERIFIIFQRLHTREEYPGTGIGLALCKKVVERHGGRIWLESQPGQGATFYFTIPDRTETDQDVEA